jgi:hypothetical protein
MAKAALAELLVSDAAEWRAWLEEHHDDVPGVWLVIGNAAWLYRGRSISSACAALARATTANTRTACFRRQ